MRQKQTRKRTSSVQCHTCQKIFTRSDSLRRHERLHNTTRKRVRIVNGKFRACQRCRDEHKSCSGETPCSKCAASSKDCVYGDRPANPRVDRSSLEPLPTGDLSSLKLFSILKPHCHRAGETSAKSTASLGEVDVNNALNVFEVCTAFDDIAQAEERLAGHSVIYPVLRPLSTFLEGSISLSLASNLLSHYFNAQSVDTSHPKCPYIHTFVVRKCDVLHESAPRATHPALLSTMMWVVTLTQEVSHLFRSFDQQEQASSFLAKLSFDLIHPDILVSSMRLEDLTSHNYNPSTGPSPSTLKALHETNSLHDPPFDCLVALAHMSTVVSASEKKSKSLTWWRQLYSLSQTFRLNKEEEANEKQLMDSMQEGYSDILPAGSKHNERVYREERRRLWWLLFTMDRHLSLCYNEPLFFTESQYVEVLPPLRNLVWDDPHLCCSSDDSGTDSYGERLPHFLAKRLEIQADQLEQSFFGTFLPLMIFTGRLLERHRAVNGITGSCEPMMDGILNATDIEGDLSRFSACLQETYELVAACTPVVTSGSQHCSPSISGLSDTSTCSVCGLYSSYMLQVLYILRNNKWDPYQLILDRDFWTSSPQFGEALSSSVAGSEFLELILERDEGLVYMPYFLGIQLLLGSLPLLGLPLRLGSHAGPKIVQALRIYLRATDACLVTLPTFYQSQFRAVLLAGIDIACGRQFDAATEVKRLLNVVSTYRWSAYGHGLATRPEKPAETDPG